MYVVSWTSISGSAVYVVGSTESSVILPTASNSWLTFNSENRRHRAVITQQEDVFYKPALVS